MSLKLFYNLFFTLYFVLHFARSAETEIYLDFTDCGDGRISDFSLSITPYPALLTVEPLNFWFGGQLSFTKVAQQIVNNASDVQFYDDLRQLIFVDNSTPSLPEWLLKPILRNANNTCACGSILSNSLCAIVHEAMAEAVQNISIFFVTDFINPGNEILGQMFRWLLSGVPKLDVQVRIKFVREEETIICLKAKFQSNQTDSHNDRDMRNVAFLNMKHSFATPKFVNKRNNGSLDCPSNSRELLNSSCSCSQPHAGPFCQFQCNYDQLSFAEGYTDTRLYVFNGNYYVQHCLLDHNITVLKEIQAFAPDLNSVNVSWLSMNVFNFHYIRIMITNDEGSGAGYVFTSKTIFIGDILTKLTLTGMHFAADPKFNLNPFADYLLSLQFFMNDEPTVVAGYAGFKTIEIAPEPPQIVNVTLLSENILQVDWILLDLACPGLITHYKMENWCDDLASESFIQNGIFEIPFDCRHHMSSIIRINTTFNQRCVQGGNLLARICIATSAGMSKWSNTFTLKRNIFPWVTIIVASCGAFIIAVVIGSLGWLYYHKRKIEPLRDIQETLHGLEHRTSPYRQSMRELLTIDQNRTLPSPPTIETNKKSNDATPYEPSPLNSPTPRSVVNFVATIPSHYKRLTDTDMLSVQYYDAIL